MSNEIDWSKAPEGADLAVVADFESGNIRKGDVRFIKSDDQGLGPSYVLGPGAWLRYERPATWNGHGLPPVGTKCEYHSAHDGWIPCEVVAHRWNAGVVLDIHYRAELVTPQDFRPIRTPEQSAADKREQAVSEMQSHFKFNGDLQETLRVICFALHDAGYRKTEQEQDQ